MTTISGLFTSHLLHPAAFWSCYVDAVEVETTLPFCKVSVTIVTLGEEVEEDDPMLL